MTQPTTFLRWILADGRVWTTACYHDVEQIKADTIRQHPELGLPGVVCEQHDVDEATFNAMHPGTRFQDSWRFVGGAVTVDVNLARQQLVDEAQKATAQAVAQTAQLGALAQAAGDQATAGTLGQSLAGLQAYPAQVAADVATLDVPALEAYVITPPVAALTGPVGLGSVQPAPIVSQ